MLPSIKVFPLILESEVKERIVSCVHQVGDRKNKYGSVDYNSPYGRRISRLQSQLSEFLTHKGSGAEKADYQKNQISCKVVQAGGINEPMAADAKHISQVRQSVCQGRREKQYPAQ